MRQYIWRDKCEHKSDVFGSFSFHSRRNFRWKSKLFKLLNHVSFEKKRNNYLTHLRNLVGIELVDLEEVADERRDEALVLRQHVLVVWNLKNKFKIHILYSLSHFWNGT